ncbi:hypothetical protein SPBR_07787 [Sporothrix brasiliensis 5110]|uniref:Uncharacterized protein n=1 Tax=Sporothrix brasiliensis 5110 TaxID=1398154 RepID=A0A0C2IM22_9PEZI|nr:uncharacterized protein SPBR_07787 [Sporothrix brasiliensis 5110]KIH88050.1 hypothetical protein SPBR_07787 [Sporothrix brasiliensis 5110]
MAALPRQFPDLAIYLTDQTRTPIVSSASGWGRDEEDDDEDGADATVNGNENENATVNASTSDSATKPTRQQRAAALDDLAATALRARDAAARLGLGADLPQASDAGGLDGSTASLLAALGLTPPEHMVVTYSTGSVVIDNFLDPRQQQQQRRRRRHAASGPSGSSTGSSPGQGQEATVNQVGTHGQGETTDLGRDNDAEDAAGGRAPVLVGLVVAPDAQSLGDARRATARLERVGLAVQQELAAQDRRRQ